mgnify:CR=1 FL=1
MRKNKSHFLLMTVAAIYFAACSEDSNSWSAKDVCPEDGVNVYGMANRGTFIDERDGQEYRYTTIGDQVWMAQNLNYVAEYSVCYDNDELNCELWGRFYSLLEDGQPSGPMNYAMVDSICPTGWHVPSEQEWTRMIASIGKYNDHETAKRLKRSEERRVGAVTELMNVVSGLYLGVTKPHQKVNICISMLDFGHLQ